MEHHLKALPLVVRREHPAHHSLIDYFLRTGELVPILPGVHSWAGTTPTFELRAEAAAKWQVNGILFGSTAARLTWWPSLKDETIRIISPRRHPALAWLQTAELKVPEELVITRGDIRLAGPELSIIQMCSRGDAKPISEALRERVVTVQNLWDALEQMPRSSKGRSMVAKLLTEARDEPWSTLELDAHRLLREAGITGWRTNVPLQIDGSTFYADLLFHRERLIVELDGRPFHGHAELDANNERRNSLVVEGWRVLNFSGATLPRLVPTILPLLKQARSAWRRDGLPLLPLADEVPDTQDVPEWHVA